MTLRHYLSTSLVGLRARLLLLGVAAIAPFALFIFYQAVAIKERRVSEAMQRAHQLVRLGADGYEETISEAAELLALMSRAPEVMAGTREHCESYLIVLGAARRWITGLWIVGADARVRCTNIAGGRNFDLSENREYISGISRDGVVVSDQFVGNLHSQPLAVVSIRIPVAGGRYELASATIDLSWFNRIARAVAEPSDTTVLLLDSKGTVLAGMHPSQTLVGKNLAAEPSISAILRRAEGSLEAVGLDGQTAFFGFTTIAGSQLRLVVSYGRDAVLSNHRRGTIQAVSVSIGVAALIGLLVYLMGNRAFVNPLRELDGLLQVTLKSMDQGMIVVDRDGTLPICNRRAMELLELPPALVQARPTAEAVLAHQLLSNDFDNLPKGERERVLKQACEFTPGVYERRRPNGKVIEVRTSALDNGGFVRTYSDVTERKAAEAKLKASEARYRMLADSSSDMIFKLDRKFAQQYVSPASFEILGWHPEELLGKSPIGMVHPDDADDVAGVYAEVLAGLERAAVTNRIWHRNGTWVWVEAELRLTRDSQTGEPDGILGSLRDISARKHAEEQLAAAVDQLERLALQDGLTGLANRRHLDSTFEREFARARRTMKSIAVLLVDVDHFKAYNDRYGHLEGDACLQAVAKVIRAQTKRPADFVARYGGEEIAILLPEVNLTGAQEVARSICDAVRNQAIAHEAHEAGVVTVSVGVAAAVPAGDDQPLQLLDQADRALYRAKTTGRDRVEVFCPAREANRAAA